MFVVDLSHPITPTMPVYPGTKGPSFTELTSIQEHGFRERTIYMGSHTGTHMDAPSHLFPDGKHLDDMDVSRFAGPACVLDARGKQQITLDDVTAMRKDLRESCFCLILTGWDLFWGRREYFDRYPVLTDEAAQYLTRFSLSGIGVDAISVDAVGRDLPIHEILLGAGMVIVENLCTLDTLPTADFLFVAAPLKFRHADGSPVRALAMLPDS